jgi:hypothetical protein
LGDARAPERIEHDVATLVGQRVFGIALGHEDLVGHDRLRHDPVLAVLAGKLEARRPSRAPLAGKSTLNRLEHAPAGEPGRYHRIGHGADTVEALFVDLFLDAPRSPPRQIVLDLDTTDVPLHGHQEGRFFHGHYDAWCDLPLYVFCGRHLLEAELRRSNIDASAGAVEEVERIVRQIRARWPRVRILLRADSSFAREALMAWCERNRVDFVFGWRATRAWPRNSPSTSPGPRRMPPGPACPSGGSTTFAGRRWTAGRADDASSARPSGPAARPTRLIRLAAQPSSPPSSPANARPAPSTSGSTAPTATWRTG